MVQLIRLVSENETVADVSNYFNEAIAIPKGSQIAVESLKIDLNDIITINNDNNTFVIQVSALQPNFNVELTNGTYTQSEFVTELTRAMASSMTYCFSPNIGAGVQERNYTEWKPIIFDDKLVLQYATAQPDVGRNLGFKGDLGTRVVQFENPAVGGFYVNDGYQCDEVVGDYSYIMTEKIAVNGAVEWRLNVDLTSTDVVYDDLVLGFRDISEPIVPITTFADLKYSMRILEDGGNPRIYAYINGAIYGSLPALLTPISDITMRITLQEGNVKFWYSFTDNNPNNVANLYIQIPNNGVTTLSTEYTYGNNFLGYMLFGSVDNRCYNVCLTTSPIKILTHRDCLLFH